MNEKIMSLEVSRALPDTVYDRLLDLLTWGELSPGSSLPIDGLAAQLGVSPLPCARRLPVSKQPVW